MIAGGIMATVPVVGAATRWQSVPELVQLAVLEGLHDGLRQRPYRNAYQAADAVVSLNYDRGRQAGVWLTIERPEAAGWLVQLGDLSGREVAFAFAAAERGQAFA